MGEPRWWAAFLPVVPRTVTHNDLIPYRRRDGSLGIRKDPALHDFEDAVAARVRAAGTPTEPLRGPMSVTVVECWPTDGAHGQGEPHTGKPDLDNHIKTYLDVLEACGVVGDDRGVCELVARKAWNDPAGVWVEVHELGEGGA